MKLTNQSQNDQRLYVHFELLCTTTIETIYFSFQINKFKIIFIGGLK